MSIQRPPIGNRGVNIRSFTQEPPSYSLGTQLPNPYPGIGTNNYTPQPQYTPQVLQAAPTTTTPASGGGGALSKLASFFGGGGTASSGAATGASSAINIAQMKQIFDRLGGIDGIMDTMGKVQKMVQSVQQMAPLIKVLMGSFGKKKKDGDAPIRRRRRKRTSGKNTSKSRGKRRKAH